MSTLAQEGVARTAEQTKNLVFVDLLVARMEILLDIRTYQRYGMPGATPDTGDASSVVDPLWEQLRAIDRQMTTLREDGQSSGSPIPFDALVNAYQLSAIEQQLLMLALAPALDAGFRKRIARYKDNILLDYCDVDLCQHVMFDTRQERLAALEFFGSNAPLIKYGLTRLAIARDASHDGIVAQELKVPGRVVNFVLGTSELDPALASHCKLKRHNVALENVVLPQNTVTEVLHLADQFGGKLRHIAAGVEAKVGALNAGGVLQFCGPAGTGKTHLARAVATYLSAPTLEVDCGKLAGEDARFKSILEDIFWQARIAGAVLVLDQCESILNEGNSKLSAVFSEFERWTGLAVLCTNEVKKLDSSLERWVVYQFEFEPPELLEREKLWELHLPTDVGLAKDVSVEELAGQYEITGNQIRNAVLVAINQALAESTKKPMLTNEHLKRAAHTQMRASLSQYARRSKVKLTLDDLILPDDEKKEIKSILDAAKNRTFVMTKWGFGKKLTTGKGLVIMFCGEPGTGKTLCAEILAHELGLQLYQISIPQVMSKYIGETEKNIAQIFQTARANHAMLLFDEADSLFTSRVKVESSVDKFSNMETNLLLQEIERFEGVIILTTNLDKSIDKAFQRRIQFKVTFPFPESEYRAAIWELLFPSECPVADEMDWDLLGKSFEISGGHIKNAVLRSAYRAACTGGIVDMETVRFAAEQECKQAGKLFRSFKLDHEFEDDDF